MTVAQAPLGRDDRPSSGASIPVVESKLGPVTAPGPTVERTGLLGLLEAPDGPPVVALFAPAGYGKTTLLAQWARRERRPVAWLTLDDLDNDPATLVTYLAVALDRIAPVHPAVWTGVGGHRDRAIATAAPRLVSSIHRWAAPAVLVLDDAHRIVDRGSLDILAAVLDYLPAGFRVAIAGRSEPDLPFARLRASRALLEIRQAELALSPSETAVLVASVGVALAPGEAQALATRTEGWAAGIYLAALASGRGPGGTSVEHVSGRDRFIAEYLAGEVAAGLAAEDLDFLSSTSVLETVTPGLAEAVSGLPGAGERLRTLATTNRLVHEVAGAGDAYRYHNLLREFLQAEIERREPGRVPVLHRAAADWYATHGEPDLAMEHAIATEDPGFAMRLATASAIPVFARGRGATVDRWIRAFSPADLGRYPSLAVLGAWVHLLSGHADQADRLADIAERASFDGRPSDGAASFVSERAMLRAGMARHGPRAALEDAEYAVRAEEPDGRWLPLATYCRACCRLMLGDVAGGRADLEAVIATRASAAGAAGAAMVRLAGLHVREGDWDVAESLLGEAAALRREMHHEALVTGIETEALLARVAVHRGDLATAREALTRAQLVRPLANHAAPWQSVSGLLELVRAYLAVSDPGGAQVALRDAEAIVRHRPTLGVLTTELMELRVRLAGATSTLAGSSTLTTAELRILPFLPTYLSFQDMADRLGVSRNTVKTHAMSIYGKLWASSRGEAVERAVELGLLEPYPGLERSRADRPAGPDDQAPAHDREG